MQEILLDYGDGKMPVQLPDTATVVRYGVTYNDPPAVDPVAATRRALEQPVGSPPLKALAGPGKKVVIGFPDRVKGGTQAQSHRKTSIPLILETLLSAGTRLEDITLVCATGLHRMNTVEEFRSYLGDQVVDQFLPGRLVNHDAESPDLCDFGTDEIGNVVQCNRLFAEADLPIVVGHCSGNPYGGFSGGYKMVATGLSGWRSIASHHCPATMHRDDWMGASTSQHMRHQFKHIGRAMEKGMKNRFFAVDAVLGQKSQVLAVQAGAIPEVEKATWPLAAKRTQVGLKMAAPADILVIGLPRNFHYGPGMGSNPILMGLAISGQLSRAWKCFREGGVVIAAAICDGWFNDAWFPSYEPTYEAMQGFCTPAEFLASPAALKITQDAGYRYSYSHHYTYHPFHAMSMISGGAILAQRTSAVFLPGAQAPKYARGMGFIPTTTFAEALARAEKLVGNNPNILCMPEAFSGGVGVHLERA